ncbi:MAG: hypothetical protein GHCLOJNM_00943 [bacterium]|nr:hypothetical protein [bacterium]
MPAKKQTASNKKRLQRIYGLRQYRRVMMDHKPFQTAPVNISDSVAKKIEVHQHIHQGGGRGEFCPVCRKRLSPDAFLCLGCDQAVDLGCLNNISRLCLNCHEDHLRRNNERRLLLVIQGGQTERKAFIWHQRHLVFGRAKKSENPDVDLTLRYLPIKPEGLFPENLEKTRKIPRRFGHVYIDERVVLIRNLHAKACFTLDGTPVCEGQERRIASNRFTIGFDGGLSLLGTCFRSDTGLIDALRLSRIGNHEVHDYFVVPRRLRMDTEPFLSDPAVSSTESGAEIFPTGSGFIFKTDEDTAHEVRSGIALCFSGINHLPIEWREEEFSVV